VGLLCIGPNPYHLLATSKYCCKVILLTIIYGDLPGFIVHLAC